MPFFSGFERTGIFGSAVLDSHLPRGPSHCCMMSLLFLVAPFPSLLTPVCQALSMLSRSYETADLRYAQCRERRTQWQSTRKRGSILVAEAILELEIRRPLQCHGGKPSVLPAKSPILFVQ